MEIKLSRMPELPHTNKHGIEFTKTDVDFLIQKGYEQVDKYATFKAGEYSVEIIEAVLDTLSAFGGLKDENLEGLFYIILRHKLFNTAKKERKHYNMESNGYELPLLQDHQDEAGQESSTPYDFALIKQFGATLTEDEAEVAAELVKGSSYRETAKALGMSRSSVERRVNRLRDKWSKYEKGRK